MVTLEDLAGIKILGAFVAMWRCLCASIRAPVSVHVLLVGGA